MASSAVMVPLHSWAAAVPTAARPSIANRVNSRRSLCVIALSSGWPWYHGRGSSSCSVPAWYNMADGTVKGEVLAQGLVTDRPRGRLAPGGTPHDRIVTRSPRPAPRLAAGARPARDPDRRQGARL